MMDTQGLVAAYYWLLVGHFVADYPLQTDFIALRKSPWNSIDAVPWYYVLTAHSMVHGGAVTLATGSVLLGICETACHWLIDLAKCAGWTTIHMDQMLHLACKSAWMWPLIFLGPIP